MSAPDLPAIDSRVRAAIYREVKTEPFARSMGMELVELDAGYAAVEMTFDPDAMGNLYGRAHGGALFALIDEAFEAASQSMGEIEVALNVSVTYVASPPAGARLRAEARIKSRTKKTASYDINVFGSNGALIATCQALGYRTGKSLPFLS